MLSYHAGPFTCPHNCNRDAARRILAEKVKRAPFRLKQSAVALRMIFDDAGGGAFSARGKFWSTERWGICLSFFRC